MNQEFRASLGYIASLRPAWTILRPCLNKTKPHANHTQNIKCTLAFNGTKDDIPDLTQARQVLYHWAIYILSWFLGSYSKLRLDWNLLSSPSWLWNSYLFSALLLPSECWDYRNVASCLSNIFSIFIHIVEGSKCLFKKRDNTSLSCYFASVSLKYAN